MSEDSWEGGFTLTSFLPLSSQDPQESPLSRSEFVSSCFFCSLNRLPLCAVFYDPFATLPPQAPAPASS